MASLPACGGEGYSAVREQQQCVTHSFNVGKDDASFPCANYFWWSAISSSGPLFGNEHGARPRSVGSWTIDWRDPIDGQTYIAPWC